MIHYVHFGLWNFLFVRLRTLFRFTVARLYIVVDGQKTRRRVEKHNLPIAAFLLRGLAISLRFYQPPGTLPGFFSSRVHPQFSSYWQIHVILAA